jgi:hypothetical protein
VELNPKWMQYGRERGELWTKTSGGFNNKHGMKGKSVVNDIRSARGQVAACLAVGVEPVVHNLAAKSDPDFDTDGQVRTPEPGHYKSLIIRDEDLEVTPDHYFVHVTTAGDDDPLFAVWGFIWARWVGKNLEKWAPNNGREPAWFVKPRQLQPIQYWPSRGSLHPKFCFEVCG